MTGIMGQSSHLDSKHAQQVLGEFFGYDAFREGQREVIDAVLDGRDCVAIMPTGAGKSLCYQVPALVLAQTQRSGPFGGFVPQATVTLVISPLVSLMSDQVSALVSAGIPAAYLNSQLTPRQQEEVLSRAAAGAYALLYVAPERLTDPRFEAFVMRAPIALIAVDEAHCVSQWGQDFRPSYLRISDFIASLQQRPTVAAFTATATPRVADDIVRLLDLQDPARITTGFDRPNLHYAVEQLPDKKKIARIAAHALANPADSGIVYCSTRKAVESVHEALIAAGIAATRYHAGLSSAERTANQRAFVNDDAPVMVATNAFGMGIDKSNVRFVIHHNMPGSLEAYYQEAGRAGRDGEPSECLLLWNESDFVTARFFIEQETENEALTEEERQVVRASQRRRLSVMTGYCMTAGCLRSYILNYFGEHLEVHPPNEQEMRSPTHFAPAIELPLQTMRPIQNGSENASATHLADGRGCGNCSNCDGGVDVLDVTKTARAIMRCVHELRGRYGKGVVSDVLRGSSNQKMHDFGLANARTYGISDESSATIKEIIELLAAGEYLEISEGRYPLVGLGPRAREAATDEFRLYMKRVSTRSKDGSRSSAPGTGKSKSGKSSAKSAMLATDKQRELFERLRKLRKQLADEEGVPPYVVFSDATLRNMCVDMPHSESELLAVSGVGEVKLARYGRVFLEEITR